MNKSFSSVISAGLIAITAIAAGIFLYGRFGADSTAAPDRLYDMAKGYEREGRSEKARKLFSKALLSIAAGADLERLDEGRIRAALDIEADDKIEVLRADVDGDDKEEVFAAIGYPYNLFAVDNEFGKAAVSFITGMETWYDIDLHDLDKDERPELIITSGEKNSLLAGYRVFKWTPEGFVKIASRGYDDGGERLKNVQAFYRDMTGDGVEDIRLTHFVTAVSADSIVGEKEEHLFLIWDGSRYVRAPTQALSLPEENR